MRHFLNPLLLWLAHSSHASLIRQIQYLKVENEVLRARLPKQIQTTAKERRRLVRYAKQVGPAIYHLVTIVSPVSMRRWLRQIKENTLPKRSGRRRKPQEVEELVVRIARETGWGYTRILGELKKLGVFAISRSTVVNILKRHGLDPSPHRKKATWDQFIKRHGESLWACDLLQRRIMTLGGWRFAWVMVCINVRTRRAWVSPCTHHPDGFWTATQAKLFVEQEGADAQEPLVLMHDRDKRLGLRFSAAIEQHGAIAHMLPLRSPNLNAYVERFIQTLQQECLDHFMVFGTGHLNHLLREYLEHYHEERPHQSLGNIPPAASPRLRLAKAADGPIQCRSRLGGLLRHYERRAA